MKIPDSLKYLPLVAALALPAACKSRSELLAEMTCEQIKAQLARNDAIKCVGSGASPIGSALCLRGKEKEKQELQQVSKEKSCK